MNIGNKPHNIKYYPEVWILGFTSEYISSYGCDPKTVQGKFLLSKRIYSDITGREQANDVIAYQMKQSFKLGEVTPELANPTVLRLKYSQGYSNKEVSQILNISEENVRQRISRARKRLTEVLNEGGGVCG